MGRDSDVLVGLDLGTKKITVAVAELAEDNPEEAQIIGIGQAPARGMQKGKIVALEQAIRSISEAIADAESTLSGIKISRAFVAFSCPEAGCYHVKGAISLENSPRQIVQQDLEQVIKVALSHINQPKTSTILHVLPLKYTIDDMDGIETPLDMTGSKLEVELTALTVPLSLTQNVVNCVQRAGVNVAGLILKPVAEGLGALTPDERAVGASVISIGGGTTGFTVFSEGRLIHASELSVGGDHISNDVAYIKKIPFGLAEQLKKDLNVSPDETPSGVTTLEVRGEKIEIDNAEAVDIVKARLEQLFEEVIVPGLDALEKRGISTEVVLTGGVMLTPGIKALADSYIESGARIGTPVLAREMPEGRNDTRYCAAAGIIAYLTERRKNPYAYFEPSLKKFKKYNVSDLKSTKKAAERNSESKVKTVSRYFKDLVKELF